MNISESIRTWSIAGGRIGAIHFANDSRLGLWIWWQGRQRYTSFQYWFARGAEVG